MRRHGAKNADYRGGVTCLYDTQLLGACLHASECGGRSRPEAVRGMPDVPIAPPSHRAPGGVGGCRLCQPSLFQQGVVGAFAEGFGVLTSDFGVGTSQDLGLQPIMPLDLPVKVRSWELTVYPRSHIRRWFGVTRPAQARM